MTTWSDAFSGNSTHTLELVITEDSTNSSANTSSVTATLQLNPPSNSIAWNTTGDASYSFTFEGTTYSSSFTYDFRTNRNTQVLRSATKTITHNANGTGDASAYGSANAGSGTLGSASISTKTITLTDFQRLPDAPDAPTLSRTSDGTVVTVTSAVASSPVTITDYSMRYSTDQSTWTTTSIGTDRTATFSAVASPTYYVQTRGVSSEGNGAWSSSSSIAGYTPPPPVPGTPTISAVRVGRAIEVTRSDSSNADDYYIQISYDNKVTWAEIYLSQSLVNTFSGLGTGIDYYFRVWATNAYGSSGYSTTTSGVYMPAGGRIWNGSTFTYNSTAKRYDGTAWVDITVAKRYDGTTWIDLQ